LNLYDSIRVWSIHLPDCRDEAESCRGLLADTELERASKFFKPQDGDRFILCRGLLRRILGTVLDVDPASLIFKKNPNGKPFLAGVQKPKTLFPAHPPVEQALFPAHPRVEQALFPAHPRVEQTLFPAHPRVEQALFPAHPRVEQTLFPAHPRVEQTLLSAQNIEFNVSHSKDRLLVAVTAGRAVGIDIEFRRSGIHMDAIADRWFAPEEKTFFQCSETPEKIFFDIWAKKEAYVKALGLGIFKELHSFCVPLDNDLGFPRIGISDADGLKDEKWFFQPLEIGSAYAAALVSERPIVPVRLQTYPPG